MDDGVASVPGIVDGIVLIDLNGFDAPTRMERINPNISYISRYEDFGK